MQALWYTHQSASTGRHKDLSRCHRHDAVGERGRSARSHRSALGRFEARASSVRPLAPPAGRVQQAWQRHPGATQLFYFRRRRATRGKAAAAARAGRYAPRPQTIAACNARSATHAPQKLTGPSRPRLALLRRRDHGVLGWRPLRFTTRPSSRPPTRDPWQGHRGIGASAPCLAAVPVVCETTRLQLGSTTTQAVAAFLFYPALVQCKANSGGRSRSQRAVLATSIRCLFSHHQRRRLTWPQRRCVTQRLNASTVPPNTRLLR